MPPISVQGIKSHRRKKMGYCFSETESLWYWNSNCHVCSNKGWEVVCFPRLIGANASRKQKCCSPSCLWLYAQCETYDRYFDQSIGYLWTIRHQCISIWIYMRCYLFLSGRGQRLYEIPLPVNRKICQQGKEHNLFPFKCQLFVGNLNPKNH